MASVGHPVVDRAHAERELKRLTEERKRLIGVKATAKSWRTRQNVAATIRGCDRLIAEMKRQLA